MDIFWRCALNCAGPPAPTADRRACAKHDKRQRVAALPLDAAERNGSVDAARRQTILALLLDGKLDAAATVPAGFVLSASS